MTSPPKLCPSTLVTHDRRSQRQYQQFAVSSWVASQSEQSIDTNASPGYVGDTEKQDRNLTTPAIVLTEPDKEESLTKELVAPQFHHHHHKLRTHDAHLQNPGPSSHSQTSTASRVQPSPSGMGGRRLCIFPSLSLVDQPIMEEPEEEEEEQEEEQEKEEGGRRDVHVKLGGTESGISRTEESAETLDLENRVLSVVQSTQGQVPVVMDEPLAEVPGMLLQHRKKRSRAMSFPCESPGQHVIPLLELPSQREQPQPSQPDVERHVMESSMSLKPSVSTQLGKFTQIVVMAKKWKKRSGDTTPVDEQQNSKEVLSSKQKKRPFVEVPRAFKLDLLEEAHQIVNKTYQMYRSQLGPHHKLTLQAKEHLDNLTIQLGNNILKQ